MQDYMDMDTHEKIRYMSESSNASTSGYSTMSPITVHHRISSPTSSVLSSPTHSPATILQSEFSNLNLPPASPQIQYTTVMSNAEYSNYINNNTMTGNVALIHNQFSNNHCQQQYNFKTSPTLQHSQNEYSAKLCIIEEPVEKFRFRYKSEMHGTHGSLNGATSKRTPKTYPEVELSNYNGPAVIRCSLFQTNLDSPHSHQLVVRRDDIDICDPHDLQVSPEVGFVAQFQNMGIIHTAKKYIFEELLKKKENRLKFDLGREVLSTKEKQELHKATEKEAKDMNLNQVRLCFEAFKIDDNKIWTRIAEPVYTKAINNRKSAQTGELRIVRLSIASGSVSGGDDLILLVEKVSKKNIKVRFFELDDEEVVWEAFGRFREADVHHQYAIVCRTPPYKDKDIDKPVEVNIELVRPSDDERSGPPVVFRYKPRDSVVSRKRRRTCSSANSNSSSGSSVSSFEVPKTVQEQQQHQQQQQINALEPIGTKHPQTISEEFNKDAIIEGNYLDKMLAQHSSELMNLCFPHYDFAEFGLGRDSINMSKEGMLEYDGATASNDNTRNSILNKIMEETIASNKPLNSKHNSLERIFKLVDEIRCDRHLNREKLFDVAKKIANIYTTHAEKNVLGDSLIHDIIINDNAKVGIKLCQILRLFEQTELFNRVLNANNESGLHCACLHDRALYIRPLLGLGCDPNIQDKRGNTALHVALREQNVKCVESFLSMKNISLDLTIRNDDGLTPIHLAIAQPNEDIARKLLEYNPAAAFVPNSKEGNNALHIAVHQQRIDLVKMILTDCNIDTQVILESRNTAGHTALNMAKCLNSKMGNKIVRLLSSFGAEHEQGKLVIKEEDMSSSSADEEDTEKSSFINDNIVKEEFHVGDMVVEPKPQSLTVLLANERKFRKIAKLLNEHSKWRQLAESINVQKFLCLWICAEDLLHYVQNKLDINYNTFITALGKVDCDALDVLLALVE